LRDCGISSKGREKEKSKGLIFSGGEIRGHHKIEERRLADLNIEALQEQWRLHAPTKKENGFRQEVVVRKRKKERGN